MRFRLDQRFPAPPGRVVEVLLEPAFLDQLDDLPRLGRPQLLDQHRDGPRVRRRVRHTFTGDAPPAARRVVDPARLTWVEESTVDLAAHRAHWFVQADHYPRLLRASGTWHVEADGGQGAGGARRVVEGEVRVSVPLVGGKVEAAIVDGFREHARAEERAVAAWLRAHPSAGDHAP